MGTALENIENKKAILKKDFVSYMGMGPPRVVKITEPELPAVDPEPRIGDIFPMGKPIFA